MSGMERLQWMFACLVAPTSIRPSKFCISLSTRLGLDRNRDELSQTLNFQTRLVWFLLSRYCWEQPHGKDTIQISACSMSQWSIFFFWKLEKYLFWKLLHHHCHILCFGDEEIWNGEDPFLCFGRYYDWWYDINTQIVLEQRKKAKYIIWHQHTHY